MRHQNAVSVTEMAAQVTVSTAGSLSIQDFGLTNPMVSDSYGKFYLSPRYLAVGRGFADLYR